jgi:hypothetical protein
MKIYNDYAEQVAVEYFSNISNTVGAIGLGIFVSLIHVDKPEKSSLLAFLILLIWVFSQGAEYRKILNIQKIKPNYSAFFRHGWFSYISLLLFGLLGFGFVDRTWFL